MGNYIFLRSSLTSVTFAPDSQLQNISGWAFYGTALVNVTIPHSVTTIEAGAFGGIPSLRTVTLLRPFAGDTVGTALNGDAFAGSRSNLTIYVPCWDSVDAYRVASGWQDLFTLWVWVRITTNAPLPPPPPPPPYDGDWVWLFDMELYSIYHWEYVGDSIQLRIELRYESGWTEYVWIYLNAGENKWVYLSCWCCLPVFYIEFDGNHLGVTVHRGSWMFSSYIVRVYRWVESPPQSEPIVWGWVYSGWLCCWRDVNMGENDGTIRVVFYMCCCTSSEAYAEIIIPFETSEYFTFDIGGWLHVTVSVHYGSWNLHLSLGTGVTIGFSVYRQV